MEHKQYKVRRMGPKHFRIKKSNGEYVVGENFGVKTFPNYEAALKALRRYEGGKVKEPDPLIDDGDRW